MKRLLFAFLFTAVIPARAQTFDTSIKTYTAVKLQTPLKVTWNDTASATHLAVSLIRDNLKSSALFAWSLINSQGKLFQTGTLELSGTDYTNWNGSNLFPFQYVADKIGLTLK